MLSHFAFFAILTISFLVTSNATTKNPTSQPTVFPSSQPSTKPSKLPTPSPTASPPPIIGTLVNQRGLAGSDGDGGPAMLATLNHPSDVITDPAGNMYIADTYNSKIRKVSVVTGFISTVAGTGVAGFNYDLHPATASQLAYPYDLAIDNSGNLYISGKQAYKRATHSSSSNTQYCPPSDTCMHGLPGSFLLSLLSSPLLSQTRSTIVSVWSLPSHPSPPPPPPPVEPPPRPILDRASVSTAFHLPHPSTTLV